MNTNDLSEKSEILARAIEVMIDTKLLEQEARVGNVGEIMNKRVETALLTSRVNLEKAIFLLLT